MPDDDDVPPEFEEAPPVPQKPAPDQAPTGFWADFVDKLKAELPARSKGFFSVDGPVKPDVAPGQLTLVADNDFIKKMVDNPQVLEPAARVASALLGGPTRVRCVKKGEFSPAEDRGRSLPASCWLRPGTQRNYYN